MIQATLPRCRCAGGPLNRQEFLISDSIDTITFYQLPTGETNERRSLYVREAHDRSVFRFERMMENR